MNFRNLRIILFGILCTISFFSETKAQCNNAEVEIPDSLCIGQEAVIQNGTVGSFVYKWDFCPESIKNNLLQVNLLDITNTSQTFGLAIDTVGTNMYVFVISRGNNSLIRLKFQNDFSNTPEIQNLGNIGGLIDTPQGVDIIREGNNWYALINNSSGNVVLIDFGNSLENNSPIASVSYSFSSFSSLRGLSIEKDNNNIYAFILGGGSNGKVKVLQYGSSLANTPTLLSNEINVGNDPNSISFQQSCGTWLAIVSSNLSSKLFKLDFNNDLTSIPLLEDIAGLVLPRGVSIAKDLDKTYGFVTTESGDLHRIDLENFSSSNLTNVGKIGVNNWAIAFEIIKIGSFFYSIEVGFNDNKIAVRKFEEDCNVSIDYSEEKEPTGISYADGGAKKIELTSINSNGIIDVTVDSVYIRKTPTSSFSSTNMCTLQNVVFNDLSVGDNIDITSWYWDFDDPTSNDNNSLLQNPLHTFASPGNYNVSLTVYDECGLPNTLLKPIKIYDSNDIQVFFASPSITCTNAEIQFTDESTYYEDQIQSWFWSFNGEGSSTTNNPSFIFQSSGTKNITLSVTGLSGCTYSLTKQVEIIEGPLVNFIYNNTCNGTATMFYDNSSGDNLTTWSWDFGDGTFSSEQNATHTYSLPGSYEVTLVVANSTGCFTSATQTVVNYSNPAAKFKSDLPCSTTPIQFSDQSLVDNANIIAWEWDFGDGATSTEQHPDHLYGQTGNFTVKLKAYSQFGCVDSTENIISVIQGPEVNFEWDNSCKGEPATFTDLTNSFGRQITNWTWIINGVLHTSQNPVYTFNNSGIYTVQLSVTMDNLCTQTLSEDIIIEEPPIVQFDYSEDCSTSNTSFYDLTDQSNDPIISREWRVNGAIISSDSMVTTQLQPGNYDITLSVITVAGCEETTTSTVSLIGSPAANFEFTPDYGATPLLVSFTNLSTGGNNYLWSFGDTGNSTSTDKNPTFTYTEVGHYNVTLRTSSAPDCYDEVTYSIKVVAPVASANLIAITPVANEGKTNFVVTIENSGSTLINSSSNLVFRVDYGAEVIETVNTVIYAGKTINYSPSFAITSSSSTQNLCIELISPEAIQLDEECIALNSSIVISEPYPNPTIGQADIDIILERALTVHIRLINRTGQPVYSTTYEGVSGLNKFSIDGIGLPQDIYVVEVSVNGKSEQFKLSVVR